MTTGAGQARVDAELVRRGLARSRKHAAELVAAGRVMAGGRAVAKPSALVAADDAIDVSGGEYTEYEYASRAGLKLAGALDALDALVAASGRSGAGGTPGTTGLVVSGAWCVDLGASTGGFTDVLLRRGAEHVVAIDVGHDQIVPQLREDPRVTVVEGFNVRDLMPGDLERSPDVLVADLSFISLQKVLPAVVGIAGPGTHALLLVKPQFEVGRERLGSGGVVRDPALHRDAVTSVARAAEEAGLRVRAVVPSPLPGPNGNREFFLWLVPAQPDETVAAIDEAVARAVAWDPATGATAGDDAGTTATTGTSAGEPAAGAPSEPGTAGGQPPTPPAVVVPRSEPDDQQQGATS
ncbi:TlyA family RNA methyltransferase [Antribacter sp. KLBMP9083]|uniref:TlyA family RNA methyltransferase n=1 Tax=Antribacter soli TaxID=2910976 RepID=A0AA41QDN6_9MICO|nr:TlyA family RNA methyltransferase [Antribacter soli]MCF4121533.1 TlyA family RNA methyltransferase [Antribacter soli]